jgi:hypothetical protein
MKPAFSLGASTAFLVIPVIYWHGTALLDLQGKFIGATIPLSAEIVIWCAAAAVLLAPVFIARRLHFISDSARLLMGLIGSGIAAFIGVILTNITGDLIPIRILAPASMLAVLGWSWTHRACYQAEPISRVVSRYNNVLIFSGIFFLLWATVDVAFRKRTLEPEFGSSTTTFVIFINTFLGIAALTVARLRIGASRYARSATQVLSVALLISFPLGSLVTLYWILGVRRRELGPGPNTQAA